MISYAGERWRAFKTDLTSKYIYGEKKDKSPVGVYKYLDQETWDAFVESRKDPSFMVSYHEPVIFCCETSLPKLSS